jgi:hypothetical protein
VNRCLNSPEQFCVNSYFPVVLAEICNYNNIGLIHPSTDCVFSGKKGNYTETDIPDPVDNYGLSKFLGEKLPFTKISRLAVLRVSIIGNDPNSRSFMSWVLENKNNTVDGYTNHFWNGITCLEYAKIMEKIVQENTWNGLYHIQGERISKHDLLHLVSDVYQIPLAITPKQVTFCDRTLSTQTPRIVPNNLGDQMREMRLFDAKNVFSSTEKFSISGKNIVLVTSAISAKSCFSPQERFEQTLKTISSVQEKIPNLTVVLIEITKIPVMYSLKLSELCDFLILCEDDTEIQDFNKNPNKSYGEIAITKRILESITDCETVYKISGRYFLSDNFNLNSLQPEKYNFFLGDNCFHTTFYSIPGPYVDYTARLLKEIHPRIQNSWIDIEHAYFSYLPKEKVYTVSKLNCKGFYSVDGKPYEC